MLRLVSASEFAGVSPRASSRPEPKGLGGSFLGVAGQRRGTRVRVMDIGKLLYRLREAWGDDVTISHVDGPRAGSTTISAPDGKVLCRVDGAVMIDRVRQAIVEGRRQNSWVRR